MKRLIKLLLLPAVLMIGAINLSCSDMYSEMLDNMPGNYRLGIFVNGVNLNKIFINDKNGDFNEAAGIFPDDLMLRNASVLADFNKDGKLDILTGESSGSLKMYINSGNYFTAGPSNSIALNIQDMAATDFDNDKYLEVITVTYGGPHYLLQIDNNFNITYTNISGSSFNSYAVASGDIDNDGDIDFYTGNNGNNTVWLNDGHGNFTNVWNDGNSNNTRDVALADLDENGTLDIIEANDTYGITIRINTGNGTFNSYHNYTSASNDYISISVGDIDSDGDFDAYISKDTGVNPNLIFINNGNGSFTQKNSPSPIQISSASVMGDIDLDGDIDIIEGTDSGLTFLKNDGSGNFSVKSLPLSSVNNIKLGVLIK